MKSFIWIEHTSNLLKGLKRPNWQYSKNWNLIVASNECHSDTVRCTKNVIISNLFLKTASVKDAFSVFDKHENGEISVHELRNVLTNLGDQMTDEEVNFLFADSGINEIGAAGDVNYKDFINQMSSSLL